MSDEKKNQPDVEKEALADEDVSEQMQVRLDKMHKLEEKGIYLHVDLIVARQFVEGGRAGISGWCALLHQAVLPVQ